MADKCLILGINTYKSVNSLRGCVNDTETIRAMLVEVFKFPEKNVRTFTNEQVVKSEVKKQLAWLFQGTKPGDRVVLHFSGHGSYIDDKDGDEDDGRDELLALYDMDFDDPDTYLLDDEIREWTNTKPKGVELTVVLDNCNSGTGTRMLVAASPGDTPRRSEVDTQATIKRSLATAGTSRGLDAAAIASRAIQPDSEDVILVRFIDPPQQVKDRVEAAKAQARRSKTRQFVPVPKLNHVLLAACRADQTAADASIEGKPCGAFSYYLNRTIRNGGANMERRALIDKISAALQDGHFSQIPQLEASDDTGLLFQTNDGTAKSEPTPAKPDAAPDRDVAPGDDAAFFEFVGTLAPLDPESRRRVLDLYESRFKTGAIPSRGVSTRGLAGERILVPVHGICQHPAGYSDEWFASLHPFTNEFGTGTAGDTRREVLWSQVVHPGAASRAISGEQARLAAEIRETLQDRIDRHTIESGPRSLPGEAPRTLGDTRGLINIPGINCVNDFVVYMTDDDIRAQVLACFTSVVRPLIEGNAEIDIISHSWGTVVAYEGLRELADQDGLTSRVVRNWFTVGAALSIGVVKTQLRSPNRDGQRPAMVRRWINLNAHGDPVGGPLQGRPYAVDFDFPTLDAFGCTSFLGLVNPGCAHGSYFKAGNLASNRDIFANYINQV